jgi:hypothetical protein
MICLSCFEARSSWSVSWVIRLTGLSHWHQACYLRYQRGWCQENFGFREALTSPKYLWDSIWTERAEHGDTSLSSKLRQENDSPGQLRQKGGSISQNNQSVSVLEAWLKWWFTYLAVVKSRVHTTDKKEKTFKHDYIWTSLLVLGFEVRALPLLGKGSTTLVSFVLFI